MFAVELRILKGAIGKRTQTQINESNLTELRQYVLNTTDAVDNMHVSVQTWFVQHVPHK